MYFLVFLFCLFLGVSSSPSAPVVFGIDTQQNITKQIDPNDLDEIDLYDAFQIGDGNNTLTFWQPNYQSLIVQKLILGCVDYVEQQNSTKIKMVNVGWDEIEKASIDLQAKDCPDVLLIGSTQVSSRKIDGSIIPFDPYMYKKMFQTGQRMTDDFMPFYYYNYFLSPYWYGIPMTSDLRIIFFNKTTFEKLNMTHPPPLSEMPPEEWTWEKFIEYCKKINDSKIGAGWSWRTGFDEETKIIMMMAQSYNATLLDIDGTCGLYSPAWKRVMDEVIDKFPSYLDSGWVNKSTSSFQAWIKESQLDNPLNRTQIIEGSNFGQSISIPGMMIDSPTATNSFTNKSEIGWAFAPGGISFLGGTGFSMTNHQPDLAWEFVQFFTEPSRPYLNELAIEQCSPPPFLSLSDKSPWNNQTYTPITQQIIHAFPSQYPLLAFEKFSQLEVQKPFRYMLLEYVFKNVSGDKRIQRTCMVINQIFQPLCESSQIFYDLSSCDDSGVRTINWSKSGECKLLANTTNLNCTFLSYGERSVMWLTISSAVMAFMSVTMGLAGIALRKKSNLRHINFMLFEVVIVGVCIEIGSIFFLFGSPDNWHCFVWFWVYAIGKVLVLGSVCVYLRITESYWLPHGKRFWLDSITRPRSYCGVVLMLSIMLLVSCLVLIICTLTVPEGKWTTKYETPEIFQTDPTAICDINNQKNDQTVSVHQDVCATPSVPVSIFLIIFCAACELYLILAAASSEIEEQYFYPFLFALLLDSLCTAFQWILPSVSNHHDRILYNCVLIISNAFISLMGFCLPKIAIALCGKNKKYPFDALPKSICKTFRNAANGELGWRLYSSPPHLFWVLTIESGSSCWNEMTELFLSLGGEGLAIKTAEAVYSPTLVNNFANNHKNWQNRRNYKEMLLPPWNESVGGSEEKRARTKSQFDQIVALRKWNVDEFFKNPIIPALHVTEQWDAWSICSNGFSILSKTDEGWYGQGIYFTTSVEHSLQYFQGKSKPVIIIAYVQPGNVFPVIEHPHKSNSFKGSALKHRCQSHYVMVGNDGFPSISSSFDELVISQEIQAVPVYVLSFQYSEVEKYTRIKQQQPHPQPVGPEPEQELEPEPTTTTTTPLTSSSHAIQ